MTDEQGLAAGSTGGQTSASSWAAMGRIVDEHLNDKDKSDPVSLLHEQGIDMHEPFEALTESGTLPVGMFPFLRQAGDRLARHFSQLLRQRSGALADVALVDHVNMRFGAALAMIPIPSLMALLRVEATKTEILVVVDGPMAALYFDLVLGGAQIRPTFYQSSRNFSIIETRLFETMAVMLAEGLAKSLSEWISVNITTDRIETNPRYLAFAKAQDSLVKMRFIVEMGLRSGFIDFFIPAKFLAPIEDRLRPKPTYDDERDDPHFTRHLKQELLQSHVTLVARLSEVQLPLNRLQSLKAGDVIEIDKTSESLIDILVERKLYARGKMGRSTGKIAVRIDHLISQQKAI